MEKEAKSESKKVLKKETKKENPKKIIIKKKEEIKESIKGKTKKIKIKKEHTEEQSTDDKIISKEPTLTDIDIIEEVDESRCETGKTEEKEIKEDYDKDDFYKILNNGGSRGQLSETSKKIYKDAYKALIETNLFNNGIHRTTEDNILFILQNLKINGKEVKNPSTLSTYITVILYIFRYYKLEHEKIDKFRDETLEKKAKSYEETNEKKNDYLPSFKELLTEYNVIIKNADEQIKINNPLKTFYIKYIVNYLFFNFFVRNQDVDVYISNDENEINKRISNYKCFENTLFIDETKKHIVYRRYKYKTFKTYGTKTHIIKNKLFYDCCMVLNNSYLLQKYNGERIAETSLNKTIQGLSVRSLGEGNIFKILIERAQKKGKPLKEINKMFDLRGSAVENLFTNYDLGKTNTEAIERDFLDDEHEENINVV